MRGPVLVHAQAFFPRGFIVCFLLATASGADVIQLSPSKDNTLYESDLPISNGAGEHFFAGTTPTSGRRRGLIAFDIAGNLPGGSTVLRVTLRLHVSHQRGTATIELHRARADWSEGSSVASRGQGGGGPAMVGDATWLNTFWDDTESPPAWDLPGGDFDPSVSAFVSVSSIDYYTFYSTDGLVADVQLFVDTPKANFGWVLMAQIESVLGPNRFDSRESSNLDYRPFLTVKFAPP